MQIFFSSCSIDSSFVFVWSPLWTVNVIFIDTSLTVVVFFANLEYSLAPEVVWLEPEVKNEKIIVFDKIECYQVCAIASFSISTENLVCPIRKAIAAILEKFIKAWVTKKSVLEISFMLRSRKSSRKSASVWHHH